jgi:S1-C subfamily serine protease
MDAPPANRFAPWRRRLRQLSILARRALPVFAGVVMTLFALFLYNLFFPPPAPLSLREVDIAVDEAIAAITPMPAFSSYAYQMIRPSLVLVQVATPPDAGDAGEESDGNGGGLGSGVIIDDTGSILTSLHVVTNSLAITVTFADGVESPAQIIEARPELDIAILSPQTPPGLLVPAVLGNPGALNVGDEAYAVGHPLGLYASMSAGIISGFDRTFRPPDGGQRLEGLIQIDAAVNPGNSGGPLLNRYGHVVGVVTGLANPTDENFFIGIGFASTWPICANTSRKMTSATSTGT